MGKSIDRPAVKKLVFSYKNDGKTDQEIYNELAPLYFDKKSLALLITGTAKSNDITKYKLWNIALVGIILISVILKIIEVIVSGFPKLDLYTPIILPMPLIGIYLAYQISKFNADVYVPCAAFTGFYFAMSLQNTSNIKVEGICLGFSVVIIALSFYLVSKLFPKYKPRQLKKDANGDYILN